MQGNGEKSLKGLASKRLSRQEIEKVLVGKLAKNTTLITDKHPLYKTLAKDKGNKNDKTIHLQKVNSVHTQLRTFLRPFGSVSSKYLQNCLNWYAHLNKIQNSKTTLKQWFVSMPLTYQAHNIFELWKQKAVLIKT